MTIRDNWTQVPSGRLLNAVRKVLEKLGDEAGGVVFCLNTDKEDIFADKIAKFMVEQINKGTYNLVETDFFTITDDGTRSTYELVQELRDLGITVDVDVYREEHLNTDFPAPKKATTRRFKKTVEADPEHSGKSANMCDEAGIAGITLRERLIMEKMHFQETESHLDPRTLTICSGTRYPSGDVSCMGWRPAFSKLYVSRVGPDDRGPLGRVREAA